MTLALRLAQRGHPVTIIESAPQLGGLASAWRLGDVTWDRHYHVTLLSDEFTRSILSELGLDDDMQWVTTRTGFFTDGALHSMSNAFEFLRFRPLGLVDKVRLAATIFYVSRITDWKPLEQIPVADWLQKLSGKRTFEKIWLPLLRAKLGDSYKETSAAFIWATIQRMYAARRTGLKQELFGYLPGGYARFLESFKLRLEEAGVKLFLGTSVAAVVPESSGEVRVELSSGTRIRFDRVVLTVPSPVAARLCPGLTQHEQSRLEDIDYQGIICASVLLAKPLADFYITNITESWVPFTAVIEMTALVDRQQLGGHALVYLPKYVSAKDPAFDIPDHEWGERAMETLTGMYPDFAPSDVLAFRISRERFVYALPRLGYSDHVPTIRTSLPAVFTVNSSQIVNGTLNVDRDREARGGGTAHPPQSRNRRIRPQSLVGSAAVKSGKPICSLSLDLDNLWSYLKTHGDPGWEGFPSYLDLVVPRVLDILERLDWTITFFIVGQDADLQKNHDALASIAAAGHEIGNHSFHHEPWLHLYTQEQINDEIYRAEQAIQSATGATPRGFRGPGYSLSKATIDVLSRRGYRYDGSTLPTFLGPLARAYYFQTSNLTDDEKEQRKVLFGGIQGRLSGHSAPTSGRTLIRICSKSRSRPCRSSGSHSTSAICCTSGPTRGRWHCSISRARSPCAEPPGSNHPYSSTRLTSSVATIFPNWHSSRP